MKKGDVENDKVYLQGRISMLEGFIKDNLSEDQEVKIRRRLKENEPLQADYFFIAGQLTSLVEEPLCPSKELLSEYNSGAADPSSELEKHIEAHTEDCDRCSEVLEELEQFNEEAAKQEKEILSNYVTNTQVSLMEILRELGKKYLNEDLLESLFTQLERLQEQETQGLEATPVKGLAHQGELDTSAKEEQFMDLLDSLLSEQEEFEEILQEGDTKKLRERLSKELNDERQVQEILDTVNKLK